jgi:L,D-transpeptidase catalytic domain/Bacterial Ig-like domain
VALRDEGSDEDAVEAGDKAGATAPGEAIDDRPESADTNESPETVPPAVTAALPTAEPVATPEPVSAAGTFAAAEPSTAAEDPAATVVDILPRTLAGPAGGGARTLAGAAGRRPSWKIAAAAAGAAAVIAGGLVIVAVSGPSHGRTTASAAKSSTEASHKKKAEAVSVVSVSPANGSTGVNGTAPITVTYSGPVTKTTALPTLSPRIAGSWQVSGDKASFTPQVGFTEDTRVRVHMPVPAGATTTAATSFSFTTGHYSVLRLDQLLSQLGYIPVTWTPASPTGDVPATDASGQLAAAYDPPSGTFSFDSGYPSALTSMWSAGTDNEIIDGAIRTFEFDQGLTMDGDAGRHVWSHLLTAIARDERNQHGYTYVWVTQAGTEHLDLYHDGRLAITSPVNTGIAGRSTADGTFPVYLRYQVTQMTGTNPDGTKYDDTVYWASYFNGGDAVHAFPRASYGWYQSLGCVELPSYGSTAEDVWNLITYGTLVTVTGPVS